MGKVGAAGRQRPGQVAEHLMGLGLDVTADDRAGVVGSHLA